MTSPLYARVSDEFDPNGDFVLVATTDFRDTQGFTEKGYDTCDYDKAPNILEIEAVGDRFASSDDLVAAAVRAGQGDLVWLNEQDYAAYFPEASPGSWAPNTHRHPEMFENGLLEVPEIRAELDAAGFDAFRDHVVILNDEPLVTCFWRPGSFLILRSVEVEADDSRDEPYEVRLVTSKSPTP